MSIAKSIRSPGWRGSRLSVKTRDGKDLQVEHSNQIWQCDHTLIVDQHGKILSRPWLTTVIDSCSCCIIGINVQVTSAEGFEPPTHRTGICCSIH